MEQSKFAIFTIKRYLEQLIMSPFILMGHIIGWASKPADFDIYFFIPIYGIGGAEYVNAKILEVLGKEKKIQLVFTKKSKEQNAYQLFVHPNVTITDCSRFTDNKYLYFLNVIYRGYMASKILKQKRKPLVFVGQCNFAYKLLPHLYKKCEVVELTHGFDKKFTNVWMPFIPFLQTRVGISYKVIEQMKQFQRDIGVPEKYIGFEKLTLFVDVDRNLKKRQIIDGKIKVLFAGRDAPEKRLHLIYNIAREAHKLNLPVEFTFAGSLEASKPKDAVNLGKFVGIIEAGSAMHKVVAKHDIILLTSSREGLPIIMLEGMALGLVPIVTPVGDIPIYIDETNGVLLDKNEENAIVQQAIDTLKMLAENKEMYTKLSVGAQQSFIKNFTQLRFEQKIKSIFGLS
jgi:glycosyltransferase involved in cell wall biosynthesis